jgi:drug/metabolite transporter (DMT)-like permease
MSPTFVLALALLGISFAGPLVRLSHANALAIGAWRLGFSLVIIAGFLVGTGGWRQWRRLSRQDFAITLGAGVLLAIHFWTWNASIALTTVAASVVLVNTQPVVVALLSAFWLREPPSRTQWLGIAIAMTGAFVVVAPDIVQSAGLLGGRRALLGDLLAVVGAVTAAIYFVVGRRVRATLDLWPYVALVYGACFVTLVLFALLVRAPLTPQPPRELAIFAGLALGPMLLGHTGLNWALRYLPAYAVNVTLLGEPVGATLLAAVIPGIRETPNPLTLAGGAVVLFGIFVTTRRRAPSSDTG